MRKLLTVLGAGLLVAGITLAGASVTGRAAGTAVKLDPPSQNVSVSSSEFEVKVMVDDVDRLGAWEFQLAYDNDVIEYVDWEAGPFLEDAGGATVSCAKYESPDKDKIQVGCGVTNSGVECGIPGASGSGLLATIKFKPKAKGTSTLVFTKGALTLPDIYANVGSSCYAQSYELFYTITDGAVTVYEGAAPTSVPATPIPDAARLTPTAIAGAATTGTPVGGAILSPTPASGVAGTTSGGSTTGSTGGSTSGSVAGAATARAGSGNFTGASGGPVAGHGPQDDHSNTGLLWGLALAAAGASVLGGGLAARKRWASKISYK